MADPNGSFQSRDGTYELETTEVRTGGGVGGRVPCIEGILLIGRQTHRTG